MKPQYLYVHVPFCRSICFYCDFCHVGYNKTMAERWLLALQRELQFYPPSDHLKTIYIGGGTPTALSSVQLTKLLEMLAPYGRHVQEYTMEANPESLDDEKAEILSRFGINRVSLGYQTDDPAQLSFMNRHADPDTVCRSMECLRRHGIKNISLDLMYSLPGQTLIQLQHEVETALAMNPEHLSLYSLTIAEGTVFASRNVSPCDPDTEADMYEWICRRLEEAGYQQYELSNFARKGWQSLHNLAYWHYEDFQGLGAGASGKNGSFRYDHSKNLSQYMASPASRFLIPLTREDLMFENIMLNLRLKEGMNRKEFLDRYGISVDEAYPSSLRLLKQSGLIEEDDEMIRATDHGYEILNDVLEVFLDEAEERKKLH